MKAIGIEVDEDKNDSNTNENSRRFVIIVIIIFIINKQSLTNKATMTGSRDNLISSFDTSNLIDKDVFNSVNDHFFLKKIKFNFSENFIFSFFVFLF